MSQYFNCPPSSSKQFFFSYPQHLAREHYTSLHSFIHHAHLDKLTLSLFSLSSINPSLSNMLCCCIHPFPACKSRVCLFIFLFLPAVVYLSLSRHSHCVLLMSSLRVVLRIASFSSFLWTLCREWLSTEVFVVGYTPCSFMFIGCSHLVQSRVVHRCSSSFFCP